MSFGQGLDGVDEGPGILRESGLQERITSLGWRFEDLGDVDPIRPTPEDPEAPPGKNARHSFAVGRSCAKISTKVRDAAESGNFVLTLGGDHSIAAGTVAGILQARPDVGIVWVDAHADINTPDTSPSGNVHGMPVAFLMRLFDASASPGYEWLLEADPINGKHAVPQLKPENIVYIGLRQVDAGEKALLKSLGIKAFDMHAVDKLGIGKVMEQALDHLAREKTRPLHLSFDLDACDPSLVASTGTRVEGGLDYRESHYICEELAASGSLASMEAVEYNPRLGDAAAAQKTAHVAIELIGSALGQTVL